MSNLTKIHLANWSKMVVVNGGTDASIEVGPVLEHSTFTDEIGTNKSFHYVIRAVSDAPIELGIGHMDDLTTFTREKVTAQIVDGDYVSGDLSPGDIPAGAFVFGAPTREMFYAFANEMSLAEYSWLGTASSIIINQQHKHVHVEVGAALTTIVFNSEMRAALGIKHELTLSVYALYKVSGKSPRVQFSGAKFQFGNGIPVPSYPILTAGQTEVLPIGLVNGSTYTVEKLLKNLLAVRDLSGDILERGVNYTFNDVTGVMTVLNVGTFEQPWSIEYVTPEQSMFRFTTIDGGLTYLVENLTEHLVVNEVADITTAINLDVRHRTSIGNMIGSNISVSVTGLLPLLNVDFPPAFFEFINNSSVDKVVTIDTDLFDVLSDDFFALQQIIIKPEYKISFECIKNPDTSSTKPYVLRNVFYRIFVNDMGVLPDPITLDIRHPYNIGSLQGSTVDIDIAGVSPDVPGEPMLKPAYFEFTNDSSIEKRIILDTDYFDIVNDRFTVVGFILLPPTYKLAFTVARNMDLSSGKNYSIRDLTYHKFTRDLGVLSTPITLDIRHPWNIGEFTGGATSVIIDGVSPDVPLSPMLEPAHFTLVNNGSVTKTVVFDSNLFSIAGSTLGQVVLPIGYKIDFDVRRNPLNSSVSYEIKVGDVNYNQTASGLATAFNPSDKTAIAELTNSDKTLSNPTSTTTTASGSANARGFGGKLTGKWKFCVRIDAKGTRTDTNNGPAFTEIQIGIATAGHNINTRCGGSIVSYAYQRLSGKYAIVTGAPLQQWGKFANSVFTQTGYADINVGDYVHVLYDADAKKVWFAKNGVPFNATYAEVLAGLNSAFDSLPNSPFFPMVSNIVSSGGSNTMSKWGCTIMNEIEDPYEATFAEFATWTA